MSTKKPKSRNKGFTDSQRSTDSFYKPASKSKANSKKSAGGSGCNHGNCGSSSSDGKKKPEKKAENHESMRQPGATTTAKQAQVINLIMI